ncbi:ABC transporter permease [Clostridium magnum]|uniref:Transport permease protein n=1 Tax=Clostridium magnum DSM 2767 TaxID=1121326 RepID=A0A162RP55_9CLOT|nr:ABC transporter permease [Clostridium magnum]KZL90190.1 teichoic acid translocation permease protein TagG [Clostridium magnum DSM 2767]SHH63894.1 teichoic acid transport system permease protein [Clostridium magnum DSM 2767]
MQGLLKLFTDVVGSRSLIWQLAKNDFRSRYSGSFFGIFWGFAQPIFTVLLFWFVFQVGFRSAPVEKVPFICWMTAGLVPWFYFQDAWGNASNCFFDYSFLVKKVVFKTSILPLVKIISSLFVHSILLLLLLLIYYIYGIHPNVIFLQLLYYTFCIVVLALAISFITSTIAPFFRDITQIVNIVLQFGMWLTPIMWSYKMIPKNMEGIFRINPMYYVVQGYRDTLINGTWFWQRPVDAFIFWGITLTLFIIGASLYKKLKPHFADVL